ncbi:MAG: hypothetical protein IJZ88_05100 [Clostridia bacterium]|nr:hypothetical protein [Clostridia bacterium]
MLYHASQTGDIKLLEPKTSNHNTPLIYFSAKRENVLVYLSNAIEKYCKETNFVHNGKWHKWASYGFEPDGILRLDEYYPNAIKDTYQRVSGYIYCANDICENESSININNVVTSSETVPVISVEFVEDAYTEILKAEKSGLLKIRRFEDMGAEMLAWIENTIKSEYAQAENEPDYRYFLKAKFPFLSADC